MIYLLQTMNNKVLTAVLIIIAFIVGFYGRELLKDDRLHPMYGCNQIARWHQDYLMREYNVTFNTNSDNPISEVNQRASDLNRQLLIICKTDPRTNFSAQ